METKIIAIAAVAILVVAGAGVGIYYMMNNNNSTIDGKDFDGSSGALLVYGNANEDNTIDDKDLSAIQALIDKGEYEKIADANQDGKVYSDPMSKQTPNPVSVKKQRRRQKQTIHSGSVPTVFGIVSCVANPHNSVLGKLRL